MGAQVLRDNLPDYGLRGHDPVAHAGSVERQRYLSDQLLAMRDSDARAPVLAHAVGKRHGFAGSGRQHQGDYLRPVGPRCDGAGVDFRLIRS